MSTCTPTARAISMPQFTAFREGWLRQVRELRSEGGLFDACWGPTADGVRRVLNVLSGDEVRRCRLNTSG